MCFKITRALREHYAYRGASAEMERRGYGSSRPELAWANRQKDASDKAAADPNAAVQRFSEAPDNKSAQHR
jgi:hypothetical protein